MERQFLMKNKFLFFLFLLFTSRSLDAKKTNTQIHARTNEIFPFVDKSRSKSLTGCIRSWIDGERVAAVKLPGAG